FRVSRELDGHGRAVIALQLGDSRELLAAKRNSPLRGGHERSAGHALPAVVADELRSRRPEQADERGDHLHENSLRAQERHAVARALEGVPEQAGPSRGARHAWKLIRNDKAAITLPG